MSVLRIYDKFTTNDCRKIRIYDILREKRNFTNPENPLEIALIKSYINTRKRNKIFGVGCKSQPAV